MRCRAADDHRTPLGEASLFAGGSFPLGTGYRVVPPAGPAPIQNRDPVADRPL